MLHTIDGDSLKPGTPYKSLSKTLARLPPGLPPSMVLGLRSVRLERPLISKLSLAAVSTLANPPEEETFTWDDPYGERRLAAVRRMMHTSDEDLARLVADVARLRNKRLSPRRARDIKAAVTFVSTAAINHTGPVRSLVRKAFVEGRAPKPPAPPPNVPGVRLLRTAEEVAQEGREMRHCVLTRLQGMLAGRSYLFAVKRRGSRATVEVSEEGEVVESRGPANSSNAASRWGRAVCGAWGERLQHRV